MGSPRRSFFIAALLVCATLASADSNPSSAPAKISEQTRMNIIRTLNAEMVFIRRQFPMGQKGLVIKDGKVTPDEREVQQLVANYGPAVRPGDRARITAVMFKGNGIFFEINGGPKKKTKWYERIQISGMGGSASPTDPTADPNLNARGSYVELAFDKYIPELTIEQIKDMLRPVFDFHAVSAAQAYMDTLPPKLKDAIKNHEVLVGMNREMVTYAKGRPPKKYREQNWEEWIYGEPPKEVEFVRFMGDEVVRLEVMKVDGEKVVRTEKEIDLKDVLAHVDQQQQQQAGQTAQAQGDDQPSQPAKRPTLRRPGEAPPSDTTNTPRSPYPGNPDPTQRPSSGPPGGQTPPGAPGSIPPQ